jgi:putative ABC transport system permease protein
MTSLLQDLRYGLRVLLKSPGFTLVAILALAIGIGANTAIFSVVNTLLLQPLPYRDANRLAIVWEHNLVRDRKSNVVGPSNFVHWREMNRTFEDLAAASPTFNLTLTGGRDPEEVATQLVSVEFFSVLGVQPRLGRAFTPDENRPNAQVAVVSDRFWRRRFNADPALLNHTIQLNGQPSTVIGIAPPGFSVLDKTVDVWVPLPFTAEARTPGGRSLQVVGRLKQGVTFEHAQQDMTRVGADLTAMFPAFNTGWTVRVVPIREELTGKVRPALLVLAGAVAFVLLIACANVANLLLARATARQRELAVRAALGAGRGRLVRQLLAESLLLSAAGGACGLALGWWSIAFLRNVAAERLPIQRLEMVAIDGPVLAFTAAAALVSGICFGIIPALTGAGANLHESLREGGRTGSGARGNRTRAAFVVLEVALALVLLVGAGLLVRSFVRLLDVDPGFDPSHTLTMRVSLPRARYGGEGQQAQFFDRFFREIDALPGVKAAGAVSWLPMAGLGAATSMEIVGQPKPPRGQEPVTDVRVMTHRYLEAMGVPLLKGRLFNETDAADTTGRIVINETMARKHWPGEDPIGKRVRINWGSPAVEDEIIGVVGDVKHYGLDTPASAVRPMIYWPYARYPYGTMTVAIKTAGDPTSLVNTLGGVLRRLDPDLALAGVRTMEDVVSSSVAERRLTMLLLTILAGAALVLAAVGIYGVIAYSVTQRTQEIGIRMALGAQRADVLRMVVRQALLMVAAGIAAGAAGALLLTRLMEGLLFDVTPTDPVTFALVSTVLIGVAVVASGVPGLRATRVDPVIALRAE